MFDDLSIIIVNWNLKADTIECIESLLKAGAALEQFIIVDNGSTDGSITALKTRYEESLHIIDAGQNLGYAGGNNLGIEYALDQNSRWVFLINNDTVAGPNLLEEMHKAAQIYPQYSILSPVILYHDDPTRIWYAGDRLVGNTLLTTSLYKDQVINKNLPPVVEVDFVNGAAMMVNRAVFEKIGLFDRSFFMYAEEVDFCWRARQAGYQFACISAAQIWHKISKSSLYDQPKTRYLRVRNQIFFYRRYSHRLLTWFLFIFTFLRAVWISFSDLFKWQLGLISSTIKGWLDGWFLSPQEIK